MGETGWGAWGWVTGDNAPFSSPEMQFQLFLTVCFHCTVDARAPASVRTEFA